MMTMYQANVRIHTSRSFSGSTLQNDVTFAVSPVKMDFLQLHDKHTWSSTCESIVCCSYYLSEEFFKANISYKFRLPPVTTAVSKPYCRVKL